MEYVTNETIAVVFQCIATGIPAPSISWFRVMDGIGTDNYNDNVTASDTEQLPSGIFQVVQQVTFSTTEDVDSGEYLCTATNVLGNDSAMFFLLVQSRVDDTYSVCIRYTPPLM